MGLRNQFKFGEFPPMTSKDYIMEALGMVAAFLLIYLNSKNEDEGNRI